MRHRWDLSPVEARQLQTSLVDQLNLNWDNRPVRTVGGVDVSVKGGTSRAAIVVLRFPGLEPLAAATAELPLTFPYIPGLLSFREGPVILAAWEALAYKPDLLLFDAQGVAHPRRFGLASHMGLLLDCPSIGVAKSLLCGLGDMPGPDKGSQAPIYDQDNPSRVIGAVVRTRAEVRPVYVSPGHLIDLPHSVRYTLACTTRFRLPEPTRWAHRVAGGAPFPAPNSSPLGPLGQPRRAGS